MIIEYKIIPHKRQRYDTVGDYFKKAGRWTFRVSRMEDERYMVLTFLHEIIEFFMCRTLKIPLEEIDRFDIEYEKARQSGVKVAPCKCAFFEEPGDDPHAPYHKPHEVANHCERLICEALGIKWEQYCEVVESL